MLLDSLEDFLRRRRKYLSDKFKVKEKNKLFETRNDS
jgi:hypothetical protein